MVIEENPVNNGGTLNTCLNASQESRTHSFVYSNIGRPKMSSSNSPLVQDSYNYDKSIDQHLAEEINKTIRLIQEWTISNANQFFSFLGQWHRLFWIRYGQKDMEKSERTTKLHMLIPYIEVRGRNISQNR
ncbi:hypothetical protein RND71_001295 [Anisodus tanguticus]|uniref:Uncharacterized protein n=1 Tax=Anisodus tanguticus TaxID=243964 RepID=A0AAE1VQS2_9SOLA|nr:hypothetical protein RND71_001295 [Anisodus tanguticus]